MYILVKSQQDPETGKLDTLWVDVYTRDEKGFHKLGTVTRQRDIFSKPPEPKTDFNWSAWGSQNTSTSLIVAEAFSAAAILALHLEQEGDYFAQFLMSLQRDHDGPVQYGLVDYHGWFERGY